MTTVDVYDALTNDRPFRKAFSPEEAFTIMQEEVKKGWLDGNLVDQFKKVVASSRSATAKG